MNRAIHRILSLREIVAALGGDLHHGGQSANVPAPGHSQADRSVSLLLVPGPGRHGQLRAIGAEGDDRGAVSDAVVGWFQVGQAAREGQGSAGVSERRGQLVGWRVQAVVVAHTAFPFPLCFGQSAP